MPSAISSEGLQYAGRLAPLLQLRWLPLLLAACALGACAERPVGPSLVLVTVDTLRRDHVGAYGSSAGLTPHFDALAKVGLVHDAAFTTIPTTAPALASLLTGLYPHEHEVRGNGFPLAAHPQPRELAERLADRGYTTAAFVTTIVLAGPVAHFRGFEVYDDPRGTLRHGENVVEAASRWLAVERRRPIFLWVHLYDPHAPYGDPDDKRRSFPVDSGTYGFVDRARFATAEDRTRRSGLYAKGVRSADAALGKLLARVRKHLEDPLIVIASDHGEALDEHLDERGYAYDHGDFLDDEAIRIPLVIAGPGVSAGRSAGVASIRDLYTTLLEAAGVGDSEAASAGRRDLRRPVEQDRLARIERRRLLKTELFDTGEAAWQRIRSHAVAVSNGRRTLIIGEDGLPSAQDENPVLAAAAREHLAAMREQPIDSSLAPIDPSVREALRSLGYAH